MKKFIGIVVILAIACVFGYAHFSNASEVNLKKVDYASFIIDQSGSMYMKDDCHKETKMAIAKKAVTNVVKNVPSLAYDTRLSLASKDVEILNAKFDKEVFISKVANVKEEGVIFGKFTNLESALLKECVVDVKARKSAVILVTDGDWNRGKNPVERVKELYQQKDCVVHVISLADTPEGENTINEIASLNDKSIVVSACALLEEKTAKEFAEYVFYGNYTPVEVFFNFDSAVIPSDELMKIAKFYELNLLYDKVIVEGCACVTGDETYNKILSTKRAKIVANAVNTEDFYGSGECTKYDEKKFNRHAKIILK
jgi:OOP family OmpA-OmpF porin